MIPNEYNAAEAERWATEAGDDPADQELARRVYTSRLIGGNPDLVMHGGGNTSVKVERKNLFGEPENVLHVKGSGWDLDTILAPGMPGLRLEPLLRLRSLDSLSDKEMVNQQRRNLLDSNAPNPSVETLLHAFLPHRFIDHTHATPFLVLANLPDAQQRCRELFENRLGIVPYIMPGFALAKKAAEVFDSAPNVEGLLLLGHGHFAFGSTAQESYERIVEQTNAVASRFGMVKKTPMRVRVPTDNRGVLPIMRGCIGERRKSPDAPMPIFDLRNGAEIMSFLGRVDLPELSRRGTAAPDHVIRIKGRPLHLPAELWKSGRSAILEALAGYEIEYREMFDRQSRLASEQKTMLAPEPRVAWIEEVGIVGIGDTAKDAKIASDLAEQNARVCAAGEDWGGFYPIGEKDLFDVEYWDLEQAKLGKGGSPHLGGRVVMVTGGAGTIGLATAKAFRQRGASIILVDRDPGLIESALADLGDGGIGCVLDVTDPSSATSAMWAAMESFGGIDILISNAGSATGGALIDLDEGSLRTSFELNFFAAKSFAVESARLMQIQNRPGQILFNISKQSVNPGRNFGAYGLPKAATFFLLRQLALELGSLGIRVNGVNADRIRSGLLTDEMVAERAKARRIDEDSYMSGNLLGREVEARHVADAFVALAMSERTTGHVLTVDGGNIEASLR